MVKIHAVQKTLRQSVALRRLLAAGYSLAMIALLAPAYCRAGENDKGIATTVKGSAATSPEEAAPVRPG